MALNNSQHDTIMRQYEKKQSAARNRLNRHYEKVYQQVPEIKDLDDSISMLGVQKAKQSLTGSGTPLADFQNGLETMRTRRETLLTKNGFSSDYLEEHYECELCKDTGYINGRKCACFKRAELELLYTQSNLKHVLEKENFDTFSLSYYSKNFIDSKSRKSSYEIAENAYNICYEFATSFGDDFHNLFLYGDTGTGKTFLANCIAKELIERGFSVIYYSAFDLFDMLANSRFKKDNDASIMQEHSLDCDLLIIDDLGTELPNTFTTSQLFVCLNERLLNQKSTIISTNLAFDSIKELYSERTFSRIVSNYSMIKLIGDDIRIKKNLLKRENI